MSEIIFPTSHAPGSDIQEAGGQLINAYVEKLGDGRLAHRRVPGLMRQTTTGYPGTRGMLEVNNGLYVIENDRGLHVTKSGSVYSVVDIGAMSGSDWVTLARNNKTPSPDVMCVTELAVFSLSPSSAVQFVDADLPAPIDVTFLDGYFIFAIADGRFFNSGLNDTTIAATDFAKAESNPDGLMRGIGFGGYLYLCGSKTIEVWDNVGNATGSPFSRVLVIPRGLAAKHAIAGHEEGWANILIFVGDDDAVYRLDGNTPVPISMPHLSRLIAKLSDKSTLEASVYMHGGHAVWCLKSPSWCWEYDLTTGSWHERRSYNSVTWRASKTAKAFGDWIAGSADTDRLFAIREVEKEEDGEALVWTVHSLPMSGFPARLSIPRVDFDFQVGQGLSAGRDPTQTNPVVSISWSDDGGATFGNELFRSLGPQGRYGANVYVLRTGLTGAKGRIWRLDISDPVDFSLMGGQMAVQGRRE